MKKKKLAIALAIILGIFIVLNPTMNQFKEYIGDSGKNNSSYRRVNNFLVFSRYAIKGENNIYIGILSNFFKINRIPEAPPGWKQTIDAN